MKFSVTTELLNMKVRKCYGSFESVQLGCLQREITVASWILYIIEASTSEEYGTPVAQ